MRMDLEMVNVNNKSISDNSNDRTYFHSHVPRKENNSFLSEFTKYLESKNIKLDNFINKEKTKNNSVYDDKEFKTCKKELLENCETEVQNESALEFHSVLGSDVKEFKLCENTISTVKTEPHIKFVELKDSDEQPTNKTLRKDSDKQPTNKTLRIKLERLPKNLATKLLAQYKLSREHKKLVLENNLSKQNDSIEKKNSYHEKNKSLIKPSYVLLKRLSLQNITSVTNGNDGSQKTLLKTDDIKENEIQERLNSTNGVLDPPSQKSPSESLSDFNKCNSTDINHENTLIPDKNQSVHVNLTESKVDTKNSKKNKLEQGSRLNESLLNHIDKSNSKISPLEQGPGRDIRCMTKRNKRKRLPHDEIYYLNKDCTKKNKNLVRYSSNNEISRSSIKRSSLQRTRGGRNTKILKQKILKKRITSHRQLIQNKLKQTPVSNKNLTRRRSQVEIKKTLKSNLKNANPDINNQQPEISSDKLEKLVHKKQSSVQEHQQKNENLLFNNKENKNDINGTIKLFNHLDQIASAHSMWNTNKGNSQFKDNFVKTKPISFDQSPVQCSSTNKCKSPTTSSCKRNIQCRTPKRSGEKKLKKPPVVHSDSADLKINNVEEQYIITNGSQKPLLLMSQLSAQTVSGSNNLILEPNNFFDSCLIIDSGVKVQIIESTLKQFKQNIPLQHATETQTNKRHKRQYIRKKVCLQPQRLASLALQSFFRSKVIK